MGIEFGLDKVILEKTQHRRFDDWEDVKGCHECEHYYTNACDGFSAQEERVCDAFKVVRGVDIPQRLERLEEAHRRLCVGLILQGVATVACAVAILFLTWGGVTP